MGPALFLHYCDPKWEPLHLWKGVNRLTEVQPALGTETWRELYARIRQYFMYLGLLPWDYDQDCDPAVLESPSPTIHPAYQWDLEYEHTLMYAKWSGGHKSAQCYSMALSRDIQVATAACKVTLPLTYVLYVCMFGGREMKIRHALLTAEDAREGWRILFGVK